MRTALTLDEDVAAFIEAERPRTGESVSQVANRLLRRAARSAALDLPLIPGQPLIDLTDTSAVIADLDDADALSHLRGAI